MLVCTARNVAKEAAAVLILATLDIIQCLLVVIQQPSGLELDLRVNEGGMEARLSKQGLPASRRGEALQGED